MKDIKELAKRYGTSEQGLRKYIRARLSELNADGEHVKRIGRVWHFDDAAIKRLDNLRDYTEPVVEVVENRADDDSAKLREENQRLMKMLVATQQEVIRLQGELIKLQTPPPSMLERLTELVTRRFRK